jgi:hypothetical protein
MKVIMVEGIVIGTQDHPEPVTCPITDFAPESTLGICPVPTVLEGERSAILQSYPGNIDSICGGMFAHSRRYTARSAHGATTVAVKVEQLIYAAPKMFSGRGFKNVGFPKIQSHRNFTAGFQWAQGRI